MEDPGAYVDEVTAYLEKRYLLILKITRLTKELEEALKRDDRQASMMILRDRAGQMDQADRCMEAVWNLTAGDDPLLSGVRRLLRQDPPDQESDIPGAGKILELRRKTRSAIRHLQEEDRRISRRIAGGKSHYGARELEEESR